MANDFAMARAVALSRRLFVGRTRELEELTGAFADASAGRGALYLLVGPPGIGKTRLADEVARLAETHGLRPLWGRCWETGGAPAYWPFIQILRELTRGEAGGRRLESLGPRARVLGALLPELNPDGGGEAAKSADAGAPDADAVAARFRLFEATLEVLRAAARDQPLLLVLDDLHAADPSSLALLHFLARNLRGLCAIVLGTYRDEEARLDPTVGRGLAEIAREGVYLPLPPFERWEIEALLTETAASPGANRPEAGLAATIERATEGNPLFVVELVRLLGARGELAVAPAAVAALPIPDTVREVLTRRLARLSPGARELLAAASVIGRDFPSGLLGSVVSPSAAAASARHLEEAEQAGLIASAGTAAWRFSHVLVREALYRQLGAPVRAGLHQKVAAALSAAGRREAAIAEIAHHLLAALPDGDAMAAAQAAREAAERAMAMLAFEDAALLFQRAREALVVGQLADLAAQCELELSSGMAFMRAGDAGRGRAACRSAAETARRLGDGDLFARAALGYGAELMLAQSDPTLIALLEEAVLLLPGGPSGRRAQVMARLAAARQPAPDVMQPIALAREAITMARTCGDPAVLRVVLLFGGSALADYAPPAERAAVSDELVTLATAAGDRFALLRASSRLVFDCLELGELGRAVRALETYEAVAVEFNQPRHRWPGRLMRSMFANAAGRFDEAARLYDEATELGAGDSDPTLSFVFAYCLLGHVLVNERPDSIARVERALVEINENPNLPVDPIVLTNFGLVALYARVGDLARARARFVTIDFADPNFNTDGPIHALLAETVAVLEARELAPMFYQRLLRFSGRVVSHGRAGIACTGTYDDALGIVATIAGQHDAAERHFDAALAVGQACGFRPRLAQTRYWYARLLLARKRPGDAERAQELVAEARANAEFFNLALLQRRLAALAFDEPSPAVPRPSPGPAAFLKSPDVRFQQEGEYWTVSAGATVLRLKDARGVQMLAELIANPGREYHVLALSGASGDEVDRGDAGELLDADAIADYRARVEELADEIAEAERWADVTRAAKLREERDAIAQELAHGVGLGGRARRAGAAAERARTNVQRRVRGVIRKIAEADAALGAYLDRSVRTGTFCAYEPF